MPGVVYQLMWPLPPSCSLTDEAMDAPVKLLPEELKKAKLPLDAFVTLRHGATLITAGGQTLNQPAQLPVAPA